MKKKIVVYIKSLVLIFLAYVMLNITVAGIGYLVEVVLFKGGLMQIWISIFIFAFLVPGIVSSVIVGFIGSYWIGGDRKIGFILASILASTQIVGAIFSDGVGFDPPSLIFLARIPVIILMGGFTYKVLCKRKDKKN